MPVQCAIHPQPPPPALPVVRRRWTPPTAAFSTWGFFLGFAAHAARTDGSGRVSKHVGVGGRAGATRGGENSARRARTGQVYPKWAGEGSAVPRSWTTTMTLRAWTRGDYTDVGRALRGAGVFWYGCARRPGTLGHYSTRGSVTARVRMQRAKLEYKVVLIKTMGCGDVNTDDVSRGG